MVTDPTLVILIAGVLLLLSLLAGKLGGRLGLPGLLLFLVIGMLAGSDGFGGIAFEDYHLTQFVGTVALAYILFNGGLETDWRTTRPVLWAGISLASLGVLVTAGVVALAAHYLLGVPWLLALLLGAIVAPTDASAVFSVLKERALGLRGQIRPLLEFESGINDPTAVVLVIGLTELATHPAQSPWSLLTLFGQEMLLGGVIGYVAGRLSGLMLNRVNLALGGLYPVLSVALVAITYGVTALVHGSGFLAVYVAGVVLRDRDFLHRRSLHAFHDGLAYLLEVAMFLLLGLLVFPNQLLQVALPALLVAAVLVLVGRPLAVFVSLLANRSPLAHKLMVSWTGLRGAVPIILATFPLIAGVEGAQTLFNVTFFVVLVSILVQGTTLPLVARLLKVNLPASTGSAMPLEFAEPAAVQEQLVEVVVAPDAPVVGRSIVELHLPPGALIVLLRRAGRYVVPRGDTVLLAGDALQVLGSPEALAELRGRAAHAREARRTHTPGD